MDMPLAEAASHTRKPHGHRYAMDALLRLGGMDALNPQLGSFLTPLGYDPVDMADVRELAKSTAMLPMAFATVGRRLEAKADHWASQGSARAAARLYHRACLMYMRTQYAIHEDESGRRLRYSARSRRCFERVIALEGRHAVERVELPFEGRTMYGLFEAPRDAATRAPCVIFIPGSDMFKEDWHSLIANEVVPRGWSAFALDGPGQGESLTHGLKATVDNYERAVSAAIDWLERRPEVDPGRIVLYGTSYGSYWGARAAASEPRIRAAATNMPTYGDKTILFEEASPNFRENIKYMHGIKDDAAFDAAYPSMTVHDIVPRIACPFLIVSGEFDELAPLEDTLAVYRSLAAPKEIWVYGGEFHPIGLSTDEWLLASLDWLERALSGAFGLGHARQLYITRTGEFREGAGEPPWWNPEAPP